MKLIMLESLASHSGTLNAGESVEVSKSFLSENDAVRLVNRGLAKPATKADADAIKAIEDRQAAEVEAAKAAEEAAKAAAEETQQPATETDADAIKAIEDRQAAEAEAAKAAEEAAKVAAEETQQPAE